MAEIVQDAPTDAYRFNPEEEPATMKIRLNPNRYATINGELRYVTAKIEKQADGKNHRVWDYQAAEVWVPPRVGEMLIDTVGLDNAMGMEPVAKMIATRSEEDALEEFKPKVAPKRTRRTASDDEKTA